MNDHRPPTQVPNQVATPGFSSGETDRTLSPYVALQRDLDEAYRKYLGYAEVIGQGDLLAPLLGDSIFYPEVERTAARIFGEPRPRLVEDDFQAPIEWTDVLRELLTPEDFQRQENGMFLCRVQGSLIEVSEANYIEILTGVTERLLQPLQNLSDEQKETPAIHDAQPSFIGPAEAQLPTPMSAQPVTSAQWMPYMSHTEDDIHENTIKQEEIELARFEPSGIIGSHLAGSRHSDNRVLAQSGRSDVFRGKSIDSESEDDGYTPSADDSLSVSSSDYYVSSIGTTRSNSTDPANRWIAMGAYDSMVAATSYLYDNNYFDPELIGSNALSAVNNHVVENADANVNSDINSHTQPSNLTSGVNSNSITPWFVNIDAPGDVGHPVESFESDIPRQADTAADQHGARSQGVKRPRSESSFSEFGNKSGAGTRYSQMEEVNGPEFVKYLVDKGSTAAEIEEKYCELFGVSRSASGLCKKFEIRCAWGLLESHREAKMQRTM